MPRRSGVARGPQHNTPGELLGHGSLLRPVREPEKAMPQTVSHTASLVLAALGGAFVYAVLLSKGTLVPPTSSGTYLLTLAFIALVNAVLFAAAKGATD